MNTEFHPKQIGFLVGGFALFFGSIMIIAVCLETGMKCYTEEYRDFNTFQGYNRCNVIDQDWKAVILIVFGAVFGAAFIAGGVALMILWKRSNDLYTNGGLFEYAVKGQEAKIALSQHM